MQSEHITGSADQDRSCPRQEGRQCCSLSPWITRHSCPLYHTRREQRPEAIQRSESCLHFSSDAEVQGIALRPDHNRICLQGEFWDEVLSDEDGAFGGAGVLNTPERPLLYCWYPNSFIPHQIESTRDKVTFSKTIDSPIRGRDRVNILHIWKT